MSSAFISQVSGALLIDLLCGFGLKNCDVVVYVVRCQGVGGTYLVSFLGMKEAILFRNDCNYLQVYTASGPRIQRCRF
jgi:hypothetical protein